MRVSLSTINECRPGVLSASIGWVPFTRYLQEQIMPGYLVLLNITGDHSKLGPDIVSKK